MVVGDPKVSAFVVPESCTSIKLLLATPPEPVVKNRSMPPVALVRAHRPSPLKLAATAGELLASAQTGEPARL